MNGPAEQTPDTVTMKVSLAPGDTVKINIVEGMRALGAELKMDPPNRRHMILYRTDHPAEEDVDVWRHARGRAAARFRRWAKRRQRDALLAYVDFGKSREVR